MKNSNPTQAQDVLDFMRKHGSITRRQADRELGVMRLASRISELKRLGHEIKSEPIKVKARNGRSTYISRYSLV